MPPATETQLLDLTRQLLSSIADQDWSVYERLCAIPPRSPAFF